MIINPKKLLEEIEENSDLDSDYSDIDDFTSSLSTSQIKKYIQQELDNREKSIQSSEKTSDKSSDKTDLSSSDLTKNKSVPSPPITTKHTHISLPKKKSRRTSPNSKNTVRTPLRPVYRELEPLNPFNKDKRNLLSFYDKRVSEVIMKYDSDLCILTPIINSPEVTPDMNMIRCLSLIEELKRRDFLYFIVYLLNTETVISDILFIVYTFPVKNKNQKREFKNLFDFITDLSSRYSISNLVYLEDDRFILNHDKKYEYLSSESYEESLFHLCKLNRDIVNEESRLLVNSVCSDKREYLYRYNNNELCIV